VVLADPEVLEGSMGRVPFIFVISGGILFNPFRVVKLLVELLVWMFNPFRVVIDLLK
jgi:hypothetical protein